MNTLGIKRKAESGPLDSTGIPVPSGQPMKRARNVIDCDDSEDIGLSGKLKEYEKKLNALQDEITEFVEESFRKGKKEKYRDHLEKKRYLSEERNSAPMTQYTKPMSLYEKRRLILDIKKLPGDGLAGVAKILQSAKPSVRTSNDIEVDFNTLETSILRDVELYVGLYSRGKNPLQHEDTALVWTVNSVDATKNAQPSMDNKLPDENLKEIESDQKSTSNKACMTSNSAKIKKPKALKVSAESKKSQNLRSRSKKSIQHSSNKFSYLKKLRKNMRHP